MYQALYRKYRSRTFDELAGQDNVTTVLKKQAAQNRVSHAYLFCGTRGTGKTSSAKILAKAVNCENPSDGNPCNECGNCRSIDNGTAIDVLEIDAASNNRVADVRELIDEVVYPPSVLKKRVYIIDEVHMLSDSAFNALLKTLEEPPEYVLFILATTELNALPPTIISRCMRFDFKRIDPEILSGIVLNVAEKENIKINTDASMLIARLADGSARDALSLLDACSAGRNDNTEITLFDIQQQLGITNNDIIINLFEAISKKNIALSLDYLNQVHKSSKDLNVFLVDLISFVRDLLIVKSIPSGSADYVKEHFFFSSFAFDKLNKLITAFTTETLLYFSSVLEESLNYISRFTVNKKTFFELTIIKLCDITLSESPKALLARISELEKKFGDGQATPIINKRIEKSSAEPDIIKKKETVQEEPLAVFPEVLEELKPHQDIYPFIKMSRMYVSGNDAVLYCDKLGINILSTKENKKLIEDALRKISKQELSLVFREKNTTSEEPHDLLDEIII